MSFACRRCGYEIRGISLDGRCPECGEPIWRTLAERVDLSAAMIDPETCRRIGRLLPGIAVIVAVATTLAALPPVSWPWTASGGWLESTLGIGRSVPGWSMLSAVLWAGLGLASAVAAIALREVSAESDTTDRGGMGESRTLDPELARPLRRPRWLLSAGAGCCLAVAATGPDWTPFEAFAGPTALAAMGLLLLASGLLGERLGPGSRRWRGSGAARQSPWLVVGSLAAAAGLSALSEVPARNGFEDLAALAGLLSAALMLLAVLGGWYLTANLIWIGSDLRRRRPRLERMLAEASTPAKRSRPHDH